MSREPSTVTALAYHRIERSGNSDLAPTVIDAYPPDFEAQMRYIAAHYNVISSWDLVQTLRHGCSLPKRAMVITFDDGYRSFKDTALPILQSLNLPVSLFVATHYVGVIGVPFAWDALYRALMRTRQSRIEAPGMAALPLETPSQRRAAFAHLWPLIERNREDVATCLMNTILEQCAVEPSQQRHLLNWEEVEALSNADVAIGPHTRHHPVLSQVHPSKVKSEIAGSWADLQKRLRNPLPIFCYPNGKPHAVSAAAVKAVYEAGMVGALTMVAGLNVIGQTNPYSLYRVGMEAGEPLPKFIIKIAGAGRVYRRLKALVSSKASAEFNFH